MASKRNPVALYDRAISDGQRAHSDAAKAWRDFNKATTTRGQNAALERAVSAEHRERLALQRADKYGNQLATSGIRKEKREARKSKSAPAAKPKPKPKPASKVQPAKLPTAPVWFVGIRYSARQHKVLMDFEISRTDGAPMLRSDAVKVAQYLHDGGTVEALENRGVTFDGVIWGRVSRTRAGEASDIDTFSNVMASVPLNDWRIESEKPNE